MRRRSVVVNSVADDLATGIFFDRLTDVNNSYVLLSGRSLQQITL